MVPAQAQAAKTITLEGRGYGHGIGMSQYGAQGAARQGLTWRQITKFYYPGTTTSRFTGRLRVLITADTDRALVVRPRTGLVAREIGKRPRAWTLPTTNVDRWRILPGKTTRLQRLHDGSWHTRATSTRDLEFAAAGRPITLLTPSGRASYRGSLRATHGATVNVVSMEDYLRGVVPQEMPALWEPAAVRSQAVAARTYAAFEASSSDAGWYDLCDTTSCQVYAGAGAEHPAADAAIKATAQMILTKRGAPIFSQFSASNGGWVRAGSQPYLRASKDRFDTWSGNPYRDWTTTISGALIQRAWPSIGGFNSLKVTARDGHGAWGGRATTVRVTGSKGSVTMSADTFRYTLGLRSTWFRLR